MIAQNSLQAFIKASRPRTLGAIICPVVLGSALAFRDGYSNFFLLSLMLLCAVMLQIVANLVNDYGDFIKGVDTDERLGPPRAMQMGWISPQAMLLAIGFCLLLVVCAGSLLVFHGGLAIFVIGILAIFLSIWYTAGSKPLAYRGYAEIAVLLFFGPVPLLGAYYLLSTSLSSTAWLMSLAPACLSTALIMTNNLRDLEGDKRHNKKTLAVRFGPGISRLCIIFFISIACASPVLLVVFADFSWLFLLASLSILPALVKIPIIIKEPISGRFNLMLKAIGQSLYFFAVLLGALICFL